jgi:hypothetical protein
MKQKTKKKAATKKVVKSAPKKPVNKATKKKPNKVVATIVKGVDIVEKAGKLVVVGKNAKMFENAVVERKERSYKFDDRLVPYYLGGDTKEGNLALRDVLIKLGKTPEMTELFVAITAGNLDYNDEGTACFVKALVSIIKGHNSTGLLHIYEEDIQAIETNNRKVFEDFFREADIEKDFEGFSN